MAEIKGDGFNEDGIMIVNEQRRGMNVLTPVTTIKQANPYYQVLTNIVQLERNDVYNIPGTNDWTITATGLFKLADAAGLRMAGATPITPSACAKCAQVNTGKAVHCWECPHEYDTACQVTVRQQQPDGTWREITTTYELDFRALEEEIRLRQPDERKAQRELSQKRRHRAALAETGAYERAFRKLLGVGKYTQEQVMRPWMIHRIYLDVQALPETVRAEIIQAGEETLVRNRKLLRGANEDGFEMAVPPPVPAPTEPEESPMFMGYADLTGAPSEPNHDDSAPEPRDDLDIVISQMRKAAQDVDAQHPHKSPSPTQRGALAMLINEATGHDGPRGDLDCHLYLEYVWGKMSSRELTYGEMWVTLQELIDSTRSVKGVELHILPEAAERVRQIIHRRAQEKGQLELFQEVAVQEQRNA